MVANDAQKHLVVDISTSLYNELQNTALYKECATDAEFLRRVLHDFADANKQDGDCQEEK